MLEGYIINFLLIICVMSAYGMERLILKTHNYKQNRKILIVLFILVFIISLILKREIISTAMIVTLIGCFQNIHKENKQ